MCGILLDRREYTAVSTQRALPLFIDRETVYATGRALEMNRSLSCTVYTIPSHFLKKRGVGGVLPCTFLSVLSLRLSAPSSNRYRRAAPGCAYPLPSLPTEPGEATQLHLRRKLLHCFFSQAWSCWLFLLLHLKWILLTTVEGRFFSMLLQMFSLDWC